MFDCIFRALILLLSAAVLTYKVVALQARLDMVTPPDWAPGHDKYVPMSTNTVHHLTNTPPSYTPQCSAQLSVNCMLVLPYFSVFFCLM